MIPTQSSRLAFRLRKRHVLVLAIVSLPLLGAVGAARYFCLGSNTQALQSSLMNAVPGQWEKRFAVHVGSLTLGLVRAGARLVNLPPEPRAALNALRGAEVGVYRLPQKFLSVDQSAMLLAADRTMRARGWERIVGVVRSHELAGIYMPRKGTSTRKITCCLVVLKDRDLVLAAAQGNVEPLITMAAKQLDSAEIRNAVRGVAVRAF